MKCKTSWCDNETEFYNKTQRYVYCPTHIQYKKFAANAPVRPWLMYKVEKIVDIDFVCEMCGFEPHMQYRDETTEILASLMDVDHKDPSIKGTIEGEQPSNYQLLCKHCHILKSHREGDYVNKKYKQ
jgi:hypothetical protein